jgi:hypothetical protein
MFIAKYPDGKIITEKDMVWDKVPVGMNRLELTLPIPVSYIDPGTKEMKPAPARTISLFGCEKYYFYNEAVASLSTEKKCSVSNNLVAKAIGGIIGDNVVEIKVDKGGFTTVRHFKIEQLAQSGIKLGA